jgi:WD40 repeat protein/serine/threonine protein kinase
MNAAAASADLSLADELQVDQVCNDFETACKLGPPPAIEPFLARVPPSARHLLARELVALDVYYRGAKDSPIPIADYQRRFPQLDRTWLEGLAGKSTAFAGATALSTEESPTLPVAQRRTPAALLGFELLDEVGRGGMGVVYRACDLALDREVAVKLLQDRFPADGPAAQRFLGEARITGQLQHPGIPAVHHIGRLADGRPFLAMKLIRGRTLDDKLKARADFQADRGELLANFAAICQAVGYAHAHKVIHRDLKPSNVMVGAFGEVQVMDWGLAKVLGAPPPRAALAAVPEKSQALPAISPLPVNDAVYTQAGSLVGTPAYIPPEQAAGELEKVDERADVFGLGAILAVILTGKPPYGGDTAEAVRLKAVRGELAECWQRLDGCAADPELVALCKRCLALAPADRPRDAGEVAEAVSAHLAAAEERARQAELDRVKGAEQRRRRRVQFALAGAVAGLAVAVGFGMTVANLWKRAEGERHTAEKARDDLAKAQEKLEVVEYGRTMQVAHQAWRDGNVAGTIAFLKTTRQDLRGWEWRYIHRLCHCELLTLKGHTRGVLTASFNADASRIVTGGIDKTARVWDAKSGAEVLTLSGHTGQVQSASFSTDGTRIVTGSLDRTAKVWDAKSGVEVFTLRGHTGQVQSASFSADGERIVTGSFDRTAKVWDAKSQAEVLTLKGHTNSVSSVSFSADGSRIVTASRDGTAKVWYAKSGAEGLTFKGHKGPVTSASFSADGSSIVTASRDGTARVWDVNSGTEFLTLSGHTDGVRFASFSKDGSRIVTGSGDGAAKVWDAKSGALVRTLKWDPRAVYSASLSSDGSRIVTGNGDGTAKVWDARSEAEVLTLRGHTNIVSSTSFPADESLIVTGSYDMTAKVWDATSGAEVLTLKGHTGPVESASLSADGSRILTGSLDRTAKVWDATSGTERLTLKGHTNGVSSASLSADGSRIVTGSLDWTAKVWDATSGAEILTLKGHTSYVHSASFSPDGSRVLTGSGDRTAKVWDATSGAEVLTLKGHTDRVASASFSADGLRIVTASFDGTVKVWDAKSGAEVLTLKGHAAAVMSASFSADGSRIVTGSGDNTARVWDAKSGTEFLTLSGHTDGVRFASFSMSGSRIVTASLDGTAKVWDSLPFRDTRPPDPSPAPARPPGNGARP